MLAFVSMPVYWGKVTVFRSLFRQLLSVVNELVDRRKAKELGARAFYPVLFIGLIVLNLIGIVPYVFRLTRHLAVNLQISLPL